MVSQTDGFSFHVARQWEYSSIQKFEICQSICSQLDETKQIAWFHLCKSTRLTVYLVETFVVVRNPT